MSSQQHMTLSRPLTGLGAHLTLDCTSVIRSAAFSDAPLSDLHGIVLHSPNTSEIESGTDKREQESHN